MEYVECGYERIDWIRPLWEALVRNNGAKSTHFGGYFATFEFGVRKQFLEEKQEAGSEYRMFVLTEDGEPRGFSAVTYDKQAGGGELEMLYVDPDLRGRGCGGELMRRALEVFRAEGIPRVAIEVACGNEPAVEFYRRFGFEAFTMQMIPRMDPPQGQGR